DHEWVGRDSVEPEGRVQRLVRARQESSNFPKYPPVLHYIKEAKMSTIGTVESLWRYPVKSMRGEELAEVFASYAGVYGDRLFAFRSSASPKGFPYLTAREQHELLRYRPRFRHPDKAARPINLAEIGRAS